MGYCECGCGEQTNVLRGRENRFVAGHQRRRTLTEREDDLAAHRLHWEQAGIDYGLCLCGCGERTPISAETDRTRSWLKGEPRRYVDIAHVGRLNPDEYLVQANGCWIWQRSKLTSGYGQATGQPAHRYVYERLIGPIPAGMHLHHLCDERLCVNPKHLRPMTQRDHNRLDKKLNERSARAIRLEWEKWNGPKRPFARQQADIYDVSPGTIEYVIRGLTWVD